MTLPSVRRLVHAATACLALAVAGSLPAADTPTAAPPASKDLPRLVDLGASKCIPCRMMKPVLEKLTKDYAGRMDVVFIDVWENRDAGERYGVQLIPTQIFYDASGKERARHQGFMSEKDILAQWKALGIAFDPPAPATKS